MSLQENVSRLDEVKVSRKEVLEIVKVNKQKHDKILADAIEGYWLQAEKDLKTLKVERLKEFKKNYQKNVKDFKKQVNKELDWVSKRKKNGSNGVNFQYMRNGYPEDHTDDYITVIRKLELCVEDTVELDDREFNQYVRNKWAWRESFISTNSFYSAISGAYSPYGITGSWSTQSLSGSYAISSSYSCGDGTIIPKSTFTVVNNTTKNSEDVDF